MEQKHWQLRRLCFNTPTNTVSRIKVDSGLLQNFQADIRRKSPRSRAEAQCTGVDEGTQTNKQASKQTNKHMHTHTHDSSEEAPTLMKRSITRDQSSLKSSQVKPGCWLKRCYCFYEQQLHVLLSPTLSQRCALRARSHAHLPPSGQQLQLERRGAVTSGSQMSTPSRPRKWLSGCL